MPPTRLLVCEDNDLWIRQFEGSPEAVQYAGIVELVDDPCRTASEALHLIDQAQPDVVLIDNTIPWAHGRTKERWAVRLVAEVTRRFADARPKCILWTSDPDELDQFAFCQFGGHNVANKNDEGHIAHAFETIVGTHRGERRSFPPPRVENAHQLDEIRRYSFLLPALEHSMNDDETSQWLKTNGIRDISARSVNDYVSRLGIALGLKEEHNRRRIWEEAYDLGFRWIRVIHETWNPARPRPLG